MQAHGGKVRRALCQSLHLRILCNHVTTCYTQLLKIFFRPLDFTRIPHEEPHYGFLTDDGIVSTVMGEENDGINSCEEAEHEELDQMCWLHDLTDQDRIQTLASYRAAVIMNGIDTGSDATVVRTVQEEIWKAQRNLRWQIMDESLVER
jgi:hypothetical protein